MQGLIVTIRAFKRAFNMILESNIQATFHTFPHTLKSCGCVITAGHRNMLSVLVRFFLKPLPLDVSSITQM